MTPGSPEGPKAPLSVVRRQEAGATQKLLTVVICSYNHCSYIRECLDSLNCLATPEDLAVIVIDDGSPDATLEVLADYEFDARLDVTIYSKPNCGLRDTLLRGLYLTQSRYVTFIASDDFYAAKGMDSVLQRLRAERSGDICWMFQAQFLSESDNGPVYGARLIKLFQRTSADRYRALNIEFPKPMLIQATVFSTSLLRRIDVWNNDIRLDDWPAFVMIAAAERAGGVDFRYFPDLVLTRYRLHSGGTHNRTAHLQEICLEVVDKLIDSKYKKIARSNVYSDTCLIFMYNHNWRDAYRSYVLALRANFTLSTLLVVPRRIITSALRRAWQRLAGAGRIQSSA